LAHAEKNVKYSFYSTLELYRYMELRHLRYFVAVAESGSMTRAAQRLGIQQPPLGQQIRALEDELKVQLFTRAPKRIALSVAGQVFLEEARHILASAGEAIEKVRRFDRGEQGLLSVGFTSSATMHPVTPRILEAFSHAYPLAKIEVEERETYELILSLQKRKLDAAFMRFVPPELAGLTGTALLDEDMLLAIPNSHPLARKRTAVTLKMLSGEGFVLYRRPDGFGIFDWMTAALAKHGFVPRIARETPRLMAAVNIVAAGGGISFIPASMQALHREAIVYRPLAQGLLPRLPLYLVYRSDQDLTLVKNFVKVARDARLTKSNPVP